MPQSPGFDLGGIRRALPTWLCRWPGCLLVLPVIAVVLWVFVRPCVSQRVVSFDFHLTAAGTDWAMEWQRGEDGGRNGAWLDGLTDERAPETESFEVEILRERNEPARAAEFWLYQVAPLSGERKPDGNPRFSPPNLKGLLAAARPEDIAGHWVPFEGGPGIVGYGQGARLHLSVPGGGVRVHTAKTVDGGQVRIRYANVEQTVDLRSSATEYIQVALNRRPFVEDATVHVARAVPNYDLGPLTLRWSDCAGTTAAIRNLRITEREFGIPVRHRPLLAYAEEGMAVEREGDWLRFPHLPATGTLALRGRTEFGVTSAIVGYFILLAALSLLAGLTWLLLRAPWQAFGRYHTWVVIGFTLIVVVRVWLTLWAPVLVSYDGIQYISNAQRLLDTGSTDHFGHNGFRMPGYSFLIAPLLLGFHDFGTALLVFQALLGLLIAWCCYDMLKAWLPPPWPLVGLLYVGLDPVLLTYEHFALTECVSTAFVVLASWLVVRRLGDPSRGQGPIRIILGGVLLGLICGASAYVRSSLQVLLVVVPVALLLMGWRRGQRKRALVAASVTAAAAVLCVVPWIIRNQRVLGRLEFAPYGEVQKLASLWDADALDFNQTPAYTHEEWKEIRGMGYFGHVFAVELLKRFELDESRGLTVWPSFEVKSRFLDRESLARHPVHAIHGGIVAFCNQIGLWNKLRQHSGRENIFWSRILRGDELSATNLIDGLYKVDGFGAAQHRLPDIERNIIPLRGSATALWFNDVFFTFEFTRPVIALLFLIGLFLAVYERNLAVSAVGLITLAHTLALAILVLTAIDRYGVPFKPLIAVIAIWALGRVVLRRRAKTAAPPVAAPAVPSARTLVTASS